MNKLKELYNYRQMIVGLVHRELRGRYKGSALGFLWTFINPLLQLAVYSLLFSVIFKSDVKFYPIFLFVGLVPWLFFSSCISVGCSSIINSANMVTKIYFPREVLPLSFVTSAFVNMLYCFIIVFAILIFSGFGLNIKALAFLPLIMILEYLLAVGLTLFFSSVTVYVRDFSHIMGIFVMIWQFLTPVMYSSSRIPKNLLPIFNLNPMAPIIESYRQILYFKSVPELKSLISAFVFGIIFLFLGEVVFSKLQKGFAEEL